MRRLCLAAVATALLFGLAGAAQAQIISHCPPPKICQGPQPNPPLDFAAPAAFLEIGYVTTLAPAPLSGGETLQSIGQRPGPSPCMPQPPAAGADACAIDSGSGRVGSIGQRPGPSPCMPQPPAAGVDACAIDAGSRQLGSIGQRPGPSPCMPQPPGAAGACEFALAARA